MSDNKTANPNHMHAGHRDRFTALFMAEGENSLYDYHLIEILLYCILPRVDTNPIAHRLIDKFGSIENVFNADTDSLKAVKGIGEDAARFIKDTAILCEQLRSIQLGYSINSYDSFTSMCRSSVRCGNSASACFINKFGNLCGTVKLETDPMYDWKPDFREMLSILRREPAFYAITVKSNAKLYDSVSIVLDYYTKFFDKLKLHAYECFVIKDNTLYKVMSGSGLYRDSANCLRKYTESMFNTTRCCFSGELQVPKDSDDDMYSLDA